MKLERLRGRDDRASWRTGMSLHEDGEAGSAVGSLLRTSRLRCGQELIDVAHSLRIRQAYLEALEDGRLGDLPGPTYAVGFVRTYAEHLGLDGDEIVRRFKAEASGINRATELVFPSPVPESGVPGGALLLVGVLLAGLAYGGWYVLSTRDRTVAELVPVLPDRLVEMVEKVRSGFEPTPPPPAPQEPPVVAAAPPSPAALPSAPLEPIPEAAPPSADQATPPRAVEPDVVTATPPVSNEAAAALPEAPANTAAETSKVPAVPVEEAALGNDYAPPPAAEEEPSLATAPAPDSRPTPEPQPTVQVVDIPPPPPPVPEVADGAIPRTDPSRQGEPAARPADSAGPMAARAAEIPAPLADDIAARREDAGGTGLQASSAAPRIVVRATTESWVQVRDDIGNRLLMTRMMHPGDTYDVPNRPGLKLLTGNAGALEILIDGEPAPPIGPMGAVRRDVALDADRLLDGTATP